MVLPASSRLAAGETLRVPQDERRRYGIPGIVTSSDLIRKIHIALARIIHDEIRMATECFLGAGLLLCEVAMLLRYEARVVNPARHKSLAGRLRRVVTGGLYKARPQRHSYLPGELSGLDFS